MSGLMKFLSRTFAGSAALGMALLAAGCAAIHNPEVAADAGAPSAMDAAPLADVFVVELGPGGQFEASPDRAADPDACDGAASCVVGCGNGKIDPGLGEACDDGNDMSGDGCSAGCDTIENDFICPMPGMPCIYLVACGDGRRGGKETCDDGNHDEGDGCSSACQVEPGWDCTQPGQACTPHCGDGMLVAGEQCDPPSMGPGCSAACQVDPGFVCSPPSTGAGGSKCRATVCGDGKKEGTEACDDGNVVDGDGCSATCTFEPDCSTGMCFSKCGDGMKLAPEACDDGNTKNGDGCSATCTFEDGFVCNDSSSNPPNQLNLKVTYRDFISLPAGTSVRHPDFEAFWGDDITPLLVKPMLSAAGKPVMDGRCVTAPKTTICPMGQELTTSANFGQWYNDTSGVNIDIPGALLLPRLANGSYVFDSAKLGFYPIDGKGWTAPPAKENNGTADSTVNDGKMHNFGFTTEIHYFFQYRGGELLSFSGDDDVWIFVNRTLALDLGGLHPPEERTLDVDANAAALGLTVGGLYEIALFHAERHTAGSNFKLTLTGFAPTSSACGPTCGDGIVIAPEQCDLGAAMNDGSYNGCTPDCRRGPNCGDGMVQAPEEQCDDGVNLSLYGANGAPGCSPGCLSSDFCGDGKLDTLFGEECDLGADMNAGGYNGCTSACLRGPRCGDGTLQKDAGEECDDGNTISGDGCGHDCKIEVIQ